MPESTADWLATCQVGGIIECDWEFHAPREDFCKIAMVCHVLVKHPEKYKQVTGNDPEAKAYEYREFIDAMKRIL